MQRMLEAVTARLAVFLDQRRQLLLVVQGRAEESAFALKMLETLDRNRARDVFFMFAEDFTDVKDFVARLVGRFEAQHRAVLEAMTRRGVEPWPPLPLELLDDGRPALERLKALIIFARTLVPLEDGHRLVWVMWPLKIEAPEGYAAILAALCDFDPASPWCHHVRLVVRDDLPVTPLAKKLGTHPAVDWYAPDLSQPAMEQALEEEANDPGLPLERRMQALVQLAALDHAHRRFPQAFEKYTLLLHFFRQTGNHSMTALCWNGQGEAHLMLQQEREALRCFELGLKAAADGKAWPILLNVTLNLANLKLKQKSWLEAEGYYDAAGKVAKSLVMLHTCVQTLENRGHCLQALGRTEEAVAAWEEGAALARELEEPDLLRPHLELLKVQYPRLGAHSKQRAVGLELDALAAGRWSPPGLEASGAVRGEGRA